MPLNLCSRPMNCTGIDEGNTDKSLEAGRFLKAQFHKMTTNSEHYYFMAQIKGAGACCPEVTCFNSWKCMLTMCALLIHSILGNAPDKF